MQKPMAQPILSVIERWIGAKWSSVLTFAAIYGISLPNLGEIASKFTEYTTDNPEYMANGLVAAVIAYFLRRARPDATTTTPVDTSLAKPVQKPPASSEDDLFTEGDYEIPAPPKINMPKLRRELIIDEGLRYEVYLDSLGNKTAGIGHLLKPDDHEIKNEPGASVTKERVEQWFNADITSAIADAKYLLPNLESHPQSVVHAVINMAFNLGRDRLGQFKNTLGLIKARRYSEAAIESQNSKWADQVGIRSDRIAAALSAGDMINLA